MDNRGKDRISSLVCLAVAVVICIASVRLSMGTLQRPGPGLFAFLAGALFGLLSLLCFLQSFRGLPEEERKPFWPNPPRGRKMLYVIIALVIYTAVMKYLGFALDTFLFLVFLMRKVEPQRWPLVLSVSILGVILSYGVFQLWLDIPLPRGIWKF